MSKDLYEDLSTLFRDPSGRRKLEIMYKTAIKEEACTFFCTDIDWAEEDKGLMLYEEVYQVYTRIAKIKQRRFNVHIDKIVMRILKLKVSQY